ncbi:MAG: D-tyrosyl-tRNA(Tyr) deacylase [Firmicutes bacterium]|nr:D-tyrosyl-tRNA(Tyr) deacylase [Bacillota bacterium]
MRVVIQRVRSASVESEGTLAGSIGMGLLLYIGVADGDTEADMKYVADKIPNLRIFPDENDKMNLSLLDVKGEILAVSQFTLMGDCSHGRRPGFSDAMAPDAASKMYDDMVAYWRQKGIPVETGVFQTSMLVSSVNWGPVTFILESKK